MAIVMTLNHGENKGESYIDDSCVVKTKAEVDKIISNYYNLYIQSELQKYHQRKQETTNEPNEKA